MDHSYQYESPSMSINSPMINYRKDAKKGIKFTFMVVGESGTGKTTFINSLLNKKVMSHRYEADSNGLGDTATLSFTTVQAIALPSTTVLTQNEFNPHTANEEPGIALTETKIDITDEDNSKLQLSIIDTPGFGENLNNELCFTEIENFLKQQFDLVLAEETRIKRNPRFVDTRVHLLLYFITPTGHGLRELDINCMKKLSKYVNIIPVIGRADSFTRKELKVFKQQIRKDIEKFNVPVFSFDSYLGDYDEEEDYDLIQECKYLSSIQPFAVIASEDEFEVKDKATGNSKVIRARQYPWGLIDINDTEYSDFSILRSVMLGSHLQDLKDLTHDFLYETYRTERLTKVTGTRSGEDDGGFFDSLDHSEQSKDTSAIPSLSNLAQLTSSTSAHADTISLSSTSSKNPKSMLLDETENEEIPSPRLKDSESFTSSGSTVSLENNHIPPRNLHPTNSAFKRLSIAPQRNQLRQISETVPYVLRHERILERQQKLEEMEMNSAKELANRAALLEQKAAELKAREKLLMGRYDGASFKSGSPSAASGTGLPTSDSTGLESPTSPSTSVKKGAIKKDETLTDLHSVVS